jgi:catechol 2,3-dioxygenase-like lactoylglutathione lyase family enzyme
MVSDVKRTIAFYRDVLGFAGEWFWGEPPTFAGASVGNVQVMFHQQPAIAARVEGHEHYYWCEAVDEAYEKHRAAGAQIVSPIENRPWGQREYVVRDPDGYHLRFAGRLNHEKPPTALATMPAHISVDPRKPTAEEYRRLYVGVGWNEPKDPAAIERSMTGFVAVDTRDSQAVGMLRIMHDGWAWYSIWDVIVLPSHQAQRIGTALVESALNYLRANAPKGSIVHLFTFKPEFYAKVGFKNEPCTVLRL